MSINLAQMLQISKEFYAKKGLPDILEVYEGSDTWIVFAGIKGKVIYGSVGISISKDDGSIRDFVLPSEQNFKCLEQATKVEI